MRRQNDSFAFLDALYGPTTLRPEIADLVWRPIVQRLRQVRLSNIDSLQMPGIANISRFEHSLGTAYLASQTGLMQLSSVDRSILEAAALIHDSAITPFGHLAEEALQYLNSDFDHELKWSVLMANEDQEEIGGVDVQIMHGRTPGLREWAERIFGGTWPEVLSQVVETIHGRGALGPCVAGSIDLDNLDNVVRIGFHMGLRPDLSLPLRIARAICSVGSDRHLVFEDSVVPALGEWGKVRELVYEHLMPSRIDFCGKVMLLSSTVNALRSGVLSASRTWMLTDAEFISCLIRCEESDVRDTVGRWLVGDIWELSELMWMRGEAPPFDAILQFAEGLSDVLNRRCFAYRIKDKRKRKIEAVLASGENISIGDNTDAWLLGVGSPVKRSFTGDENRRIVSLAEQTFQSDYVRTDVAEATLF